MRISWIITLPGLLSIVSALAIQKRDADFYSVRTKLHKDMSGRRGDPSGKYFRKFLFSSQREFIVAELATLDDLSELSGP